MNRKQRRAANKSSGPTSSGPSRAVQEVLADAIRLHQVGSLGEAERLYQQVLAVQPDHPDGLHLLGVIAYQEGRPDLAVDRIGKALAAKPHFPEAHNNLGNALWTQGRRDDAIASYRKALELQPDYTEAFANLVHALLDQDKLDEAVASCRKPPADSPGSAKVLLDVANACRIRGKLDEAVGFCRKALDANPGYPEASLNLGIALKGQGRLEEALASIRRAIELRPDYPEAISNLGNGLLDRGQVDDAIRCYRKALELKPDFPDALSNLASALRDQGNLDEAIACCKRAIELRPAYPHAHSNLGSALMDRSQLDEAVACFRKAVELEPNFPEALGNLGIALKEKGQVDEAVGCFRRALGLKPDVPEVHNNLGIALAEQGRLDDALASFRAALALRADYPDAYSNIVLTLHYAEQPPNQQLLHTVRRCADLLQRAPSRRIFANVSAADRRLRVGYVSGDLRSHPVGFFLTKVLRAHNPAEVEIFCYGNSDRSDGITAELRAGADHWRIITRKSDAEVDALIRQDGIDILIDLSGHTAKNRLAVFAGRAAPVQATWLGYFGTTGLEAMDYVLADRFVVLPTEEALFSETVRRLPDSYLCFAPPDFEVPILDRPEGDLVLGCFNNWSKVSDGAVSLWARILSEIPNCRLFLKTKGLDNPETRQLAAGRFARHGIAPDRVVLEGPSSRAQLLAAYNRVDLALDPFPYGGGTTTAEALWMGVPVVTLRGDRWVGRVSESILSTVGLPDLVAGDADEYVGTVRRLAGDRARRDDLRRTLRSMMVGSPLCDGPRFARSLEAAYREMWRSWCVRNAS